MHWQADRRQTGRDIAAAVILFAIGLVLLWAGGYSTYIHDRVGALRLIPLTLVCLGVAMRRGLPVVCLLVGIVGFVLDVFLGLAIATVLIFTDNLYSATVHGPRRMPVVLTAVTALLTVVAGVLGTVYLNTADGIVLAALTFAVLASPVLYGIVVLQHRNRAALEREQAEQVVRLAELDRRAAVGEERARMARELHDTIANHFSAVAIQATALLSRPDMDVATVRQVVATIRENSLSGLTEMRRTVDLLRSPDGDGDSPVQHRISELDDLVDRMRAIGLDVTVRVDGEPRGLPVAVDFAGYRIVQEALTNALKHGRDARLRVAYLADRLSITVENELADTDDEVPGSGNGLVGMRERATMLAGSFTADRVDGRWRVHAELPTADDITAISEVDR